MFEDLSDPLPELTIVPRNVNVDLTIGTSGSDPSSKSSSNTSSESSLDTSSNLSGKSDVEILPAKPAMTTKTRSPLQENRDHCHGFPPHKKEDPDEAHYQFCSKSAATTAEGPEGEPWPRPPRRCEEDVSAHKRDEQ